MKVKEKIVRMEEVEEEKMKLEVYISRGKVQERGNLPPRLASLGLRPASNWQHRPAGLSLLGS